jgi:hypothetical protein
MLHFWLNREYVRSDQLAPVAIKAKKQLIFFVHSCSSDHEIDLKSGESGPKSLMRAFLEERNLKSPDFVMRI